MGPKSKPKICQHDFLRFEPSPNAERVGFPSMSTVQLAAAAKFGTKEERPKLSDALSSTFPSPLVLPDDALAADEDEWEGQTVDEWRPAQYRNKVTNARRVLYLAAPPTCSVEVSDDVEAWARPLGHKANAAEAVDVRDVAEYLRAFYHGMEVRLLSDDLQFVRWDEPTVKRSKKARNDGRADRASKVSMIGLATSAEVIGIRTRDCQYDKQFRRQINLTDLLDVAIAVVPKDAYALVMLVNHDLYEDDDDDFACGRGKPDLRISNEWTQPESHLSSTDFGSLRR